MQRSFSKFLKSLSQDLHWNVLKPRAACPIIQSALWKMVTGLCHWSEICSKQSKTCKRHRAVLYHRGDLYVLLAGLAISCLSLSSSRSRCCSFSSSSFCFCCCSFRALFWNPATPNTYPTCHQRPFRSLFAATGTFNLVVFSWSMIISFLMFTSLFW